MKIKYLSLTLQFQNDLRMKRLLLIFILFCGIIPVNAQLSKLAFLCKKGEPFYVFLNGIQQNEKPGIIVKIENVPAPNYKLKIVFANHFIRPIEKQIFFTAGMETNYLIKRRSSKEYYLSVLSVVPKIKDVDTVKYQEIVTYSSIPLPFRKNGTAEAE